jgi:siroheme synthase (precorrin-2 oxidase/ferrochelatase)
MQKKLTITVDELIYDGLYRVVGSRRISRFIEDLVRPHVIEEDLSSAYAEMAADESRELEAAEWSNFLLVDVADETR